VRVVREKDCFSVVAKIDVNNGPIGGIAATEDGRSVLVTNAGGDSVSIIDTRAGAVVATIPGIPEPLSIAVGGRDRACVASASATHDALAVLDLRAKRLVGKHPVAFSVTDVAMSPNARQVHCSVTAGGRAGVAALDTTTGAGDVVTISATPGTTADSVRISPDGRRLYVAVHGPSSDQLVLMETHRLRVVGSVEIGSPIRDVAVSPNGNTVYVASCSPDFGAVLDVIDTRSGMLTGTAKITGAGFVTQLARSADGERAYLVNEHGVTVLSTATLDVMDSVTVGGSPSCAVEIAGGTRLCIADYAGVVTVVSTSSGSVRADDDITARHEWALPELLDFAPALA
jgi:YVTN family beta-propeller protein